MDRKKAKNFGLWSGFELWTSALTPLGLQQKDIRLSKRRRQHEGTSAFTQTVRESSQDAPSSERLRRRTIRLRLKRLRDNAFGSTLLRLSAFGASASILGQHLRGKRLRPYAFGGTSSTDTCAFGGTGHLRRERLRRDKTEERKGQDALTSVNVFGGSAFGDAPTSTDTFKGMLRRCGKAPLAEDVRLRPCAFGDAERDRSEIGQRRSPSPPRLRRYASRAKSTDDGGNQILLMRVSPHNG
ncbi:hypothetical protein AXG93_1129s1230 [Marchantia polymorpha subsp. ruderalis]|uniref:Uncharacterized protein n=1 Tax=Marchantia polymorpha subsp. ruderalis TaxID=1480154 RepID=A0A176W133_MARPO|nr:hypothetical protein AXG93_1129s1230 [Marchantia polymorpha subsp. ruderalis]